MNDGKRDWPIPSAATPLTRRTVHVSTGPRTEAGRLRSSLNAVKHGLGAQHLLLPGEDRDEYQRRLDGVFVAFAPRNEVEAQLVALIGDDLWRLDRLGRIETALGTARIEELLAATDSADRAGRISNAIGMLGRALVLMESTPADEPGNRHALKTLRDALDLVAETQPGVAPEAMAACAVYVLRLENPDDGPVLLEDAYTGLVGAAKAVMARLLELGAEIDVEQDGLRQAISTIAVPNEKELAKVGRYRRMLEDGLQRRLQSLELLRTLSRGTSVDPGADQRSREFRLRLRVVA